MLQEEEAKRTALRACLCAAVSAAQLIYTMIPGNRGFHFLWFSVSAVWCVNHFLLWNVFQPHVWVKRLQKMVVYTLGLYLIFCIIAYNVKNVFTLEKWKTVPGKPFSFCVENAPYNPKQFFAILFLQWFHLLLTSDSIFMQSKWTFTLKYVSRLFSISWAKIFFQIFCKKCFLTRKD